MSRRKVKKKIKRKDNTGYQVRFPFNSIISMLIAAAEVYPKEAFGTVYGTRIGNKFLPKGIVPYQLAKRTKRSASIEPGHHVMMNKLLCSFKSVEQIGTWHTHPYTKNEVCSTTPSLTDCESTAAKELEIIVALKPASKKVPWRYNPSSKTFTGTFNKYYVQLRVFYKPAETTKRMRRCEIVTDFQDL